MGYLLQSLILEVIVSCVFLTGAKWRIWDLLLGNVTLQNVEFLKTKEFTLTPKQCMFVCTVCTLCAYCSSP